MFLVICYAILPFPQYYDPCVHKVYLYYITSVTRYNKKITLTKCIVKSNSSKPPILILFPYNSKKYQSVINFFTTI